MHILEIPQTTGSNLIKWRIGENTCSSGSCCTLAERPEFPPPPPCANDCRDTARPAKNGMDTGLVEGRVEEGRNRRWVDWAPEGGQDQQHWDMPYPFSSQASQLRSTWIWASDITAGTYLWERRQMLTYPMGIIRSQNYPAGSSVAHIRAAASPHRN